MKRRLNLKGKVLVTSLTIMLSVVIYVLVACTDVFSQIGVIGQLGLILAWIWLTIGQISVYAMVWE